MRFTFSLAPILMASLAASTTALAESDRSGTFECACTGDRCLDEVPFTVSYERDRQWMTVEGRNWIYSGVVSRQESKSTGTVYLTLPSGYSVMAQPQTLEVQTDGTVKLHGSRLDCRRI